MESRPQPCSYCPLRWVCTFYPPPLRLEERLGLIRARVLGGNEAAGDMIAFLDAHCRVSPNWLETPHRLIMEVGLIFVNE